MKSSLAFLLMLLPAGGLRADSLVLKGDARLTGTVLSIKGEGAVELTSSVSRQPLLLKADAVEKVEFSVPDSNEKPPGALVELVNGDRLPVEIEGLDDGKLEVSNPDAGRLSIPRAAVKSLQLGISRSGPLYTGPRDLSEWTAEPASPRNWRFANGALVASGSATASRMIGLPTRFILKFSVRWQSNPNLRVYFAEPLAPDAGPVDRYYLQVGPPGVGVTRESSDGKREQTIIAPTPLQDQLSGNQMDIEVRVDRKSGRIHLLLNGAAQGAGVDPVNRPPEGNGITFVSNSPAGFNQEIRAIEVMEYDSSHARHLSEERGNPRMDSLISREEERWGGNLLGIHKTPEATVFSFKSDFQPEPLEIPQTEVSTLFFAAPDPAPKVEGKTPFSLKLRGDGLLQVSSCDFASDAVTVRHPLLGDLKLARASVLAIERVESRKEENK